MIIPKITHINRKVLLGVNEVLKPWGLNASDWRVFTYLSMHSQGTASSIAITYDMDKAAISRTISKLESCGFLLITESSDKREKLLELSQAGKEIYFDANVKVKAYSNQILEGINYLEQGTLLHLLDKVNENIERVGELR